MLEIIDKNIRITRGNMLPITVTADNEIDGSDYVFQVNDIIRFQIFDSKDANKIYLKKDFKVEEKTTEEIIIISAEEMKIGEIKNRAVEYWYEIELNPDTDETMTIVGYELNEKNKPNPAVITILPEAGDEKTEGGDA
jgi:hypothetical protein